MLHLTKSSNLFGIESFEVNVQVDITRGLPCFSIVGLASTEIKESRERVKSAIINSGFKFPRNRIIVNLSPADVRKSGSILDFAIAIAIIREVLNKSENYLYETYFVGELSLNGQLNFTKGILPIVMGAKKRGIKRIFIPFKNFPECYLINDIKIIPVKSLSDCIKYINNENYKKNKKLKIKEEKKQINNLMLVEEKNDEIFYEDAVDFKYIKGNSYAKRCAEVCVAGNHNFFMIGAPGSGKTLLANAIRTIMPKMNLYEKLEVSKIYSLAGLLNNGKLINKRPFRAPHHTSTKVALIGGGRNANPGEITLANKGILFLDEIAEFDKNILETLRQPIEDGSINICRLKKNVKYPAKWILVAAMNPCPCGYFNTGKECTCKAYEIHRYLNRLSGPLLDRFDIFAEVISTPAKEMLSNNKEESSQNIKNRIEKARNIQNNRYKKFNFDTNNEIGVEQLSIFCIMNRDAKRFLEMIFNKYELSTRGYTKLLKVARTIADLKSKEVIEEEEIFEAFSFRETYYNFFENKGIL